jgi:hypothetical protein
MNDKEHFYIVLLFGISIFWIIISIATGIINDQNNYVALMWIVVPIVSICLPLSCVGCIETFYKAANESSSSSANPVNNPPAQVLGGPICFEERRESGPIGFEEQFRAIENASPKSILVVQPIILAEIRDCAICLDKKQSTVLNCGHSVLCGECADKVDQCPVCQKEVVNIKEDYYTRREFCPSEQTSGRDV